MYLPQPTGGDFQPPPSGTHIAICYRLIDLGTQAVEWQGTQKTQRKILVSWELPTELMTEGEKAGQPFSIGRRYTLSMHEKAGLRRDLEAWRGKAFVGSDFSGPNRFNIRNIVGKPCLVTIIHEAKDGKVYANLKSVSAVPKGMAVPAAINPPVYFSLDREFFDAGTLEGLSDKLKETIKGSPEYRELIDANYRRPTDGPEDAHHLDDEVPF